MPGRWSDTPSKVVHHIYKDIWAPAIGESLLCEREPGNSMDPYAAAVIQRLRSGSASLSSGTVVGHVLQKISAACNLFLRKNGDITCTITGHRRHSTDLPQGGLDVPCNFMVKKKI